MVKFLFYLFKAIRPRQWIKNIAVFAPIVFTGQFFNPELFNISLQSFFIFCLLSSGSYLINDILDVSRDRLHPFKKLRPIASGKVPILIALLTSFTFLFIAFVWSLFINPPFFIVIVLLFFILHMTYSFILKHIPVLDIMAIAFGYFLRVYGGEFATSFHLPIWLSLCVWSLSLFLAIGKRRAELTLLLAQSGSVIKARPTLGHYSEKLLDVYTAMFANSTWITYAFYTFLEKPPKFRQAPTILFLEYFPRLTERKWLMLTIPFVLFGIMRYMQLIYEHHYGESPERVITTDKFLLLTVSFWALSVMGIIYLF